MAAKSVKVERRSRPRKREVEPRASTTKIAVTPKRPTISIIGSGRLGTAFAIALASQGYQIEAVVSRRLSKARRVALMLSPSTVALATSQLQRLPQTDVLLITTPDDVIESISERLARTLKWNGDASVALHASGALSSTVLKDLAEIGFSTGSIHPLMSISDPHVGAASLAGAYFCIEGEPGAIRIARSLVDRFGGKSFSIRSRDKVLYHAAAVMSSGHVTALYDLAAGLLIKCGLSEKLARDALLPLVSSTVANLELKSPSKALTGSFARADSETIKKHLAALKQKGGRDALATYILLGERSLLLATSDGADPDNVRRIKRLLKNAK